MAKVFIAKFDGGRCSGCGDQVRQGDEVSYAVDNLVHAECNPSSVYNDDELMESDFYYEDNYG